MKMRHSPNAVRNHSGIEESVALRADILNLFKSWLTRILYRQRGRGARQHGAAFRAGVHFAVFRDGERQGCESHGWRCPESSGKADGFEKTA